MTDAEILALSIEELEWDIAKHIFGLFVFRELDDGKLYVGTHPMRHEWQELPQYARDIVAAKAASDAVMGGDPRWDIHISCYGISDTPKYRVWMWKLYGGGFTVEAPTEEEARARAALTAHWRMKR